MTRDITDINAIESEGGIVATLIRHPDFLVCDEELKPEHFTNAENKYIFTAIKMLYEAGVEDIDAFNILEILDSTDETKRYAKNLTADQINEIIEWSDALVRNSPENYKMLTKNVKDAAFRRDTYGKLKECESYCFDKNVENIEQKVYETIDHVMLEYNANTELKLYRDVADEVFESIDKVWTKETELIKFPFEHLNEYVVMEPGECVCFAAPAKAGKSSILLTTLYYLLSEGKSVLYVDSEISTRLFTMRLLAHMTKIPFRAIRSGTYSKEERDELIKANNWLKQQKYIHEYVPIMDDSTLWMLAKKAKNLINMDVIIVDYLKANSNDDQAYTVYASLGRITDTLKNRIAGEMKIAAVTAAQTNDSGKIADSAKIARNVSTVVTITQKTQNELDPADPMSTRKLRVTFNRNGPQMSENEWIDMCFDGDHCYYYEAERQHDTSNAAPF